MMKKLFVLILSVVIIFNFTGCRSDNDVTENESTSVTNDLKLSEKDNVMIFDEWCIDSNDKNQIIKYNVNNPADFVVLAECGYDYMLVGNLLFYVVPITDSAEGEVICMDLTNNELKTIDKTCFHETVRNKTIFYDEVTKKDIYYWSADAKELIKYNLEKVSKEIAYKHDDLSVLCNNWKCIDGVIYNYSIESNACNLVLKIEGGKAEYLNAFAEAEF